MFNDIFGLAQLFSCIFMTGVIAIIQFIHYPSFSMIERRQFENFHQQHTRALGFIAGPMMCVELISAIAMAIDGQFWWIVNLMVVLLLWGLTFLISVPAHNRLALGFNESSWQYLVKTNWLRTILWGVRSAVFAAVLLLNAPTLKSLMK